MIEVVMTMAHKASGMRGWTDVGSDVNWSEYGGRWARLAKDGSVYVLDFTNMWDVVGERECKANKIPQYECTVKCVELPDLSVEKLTQALSCCGWRFETRTGLVVEIVSDMGDVVATNSDKKRYALTLAEVCVAYGRADRIDNYTGNSYPARIRAKARRSAEATMKVFGG
jgi:hypothetical protein